jgi:SnoaL-like domain
MDTATDVITTMFHAVDDLDWATVGRCCAPVLTTDYTSLWGGEPGRPSIDDVITDWGGMAPGFHSTQHRLGPFALIDASETLLTVGTNVRGRQLVARARARSAAGEGRA